MFDVHSRCAFSPIAHYAGLENENPAGWNEGEGGRETDWAGEGRLYTIYGCEPTLSIRLFSALHLLVPRGNPALGAAKPARNSRVQKEGGPRERDSWPGKFLLTCRCAALSFRVFYC